MEKIIIEQIIFQIILKLRAGNLRKSVWVNESKDPSVFSTPSYSLQAGWGMITKSWKERGKNPQSKIQKRRVVSNCQEKRRKFSKKKCWYAKAKRSEQRHPAERGMGESRAAGHNEEKRKAWREIKAVRCWALGRKAWEFAIMDNGASRRRPGSFVEFAFFLIFIWFLTFK